MLCANHLCSFTPALASHVFMDLDRSWKEQGSIEDIFPSDLLGNEFFTMDMNYHKDNAKTAL